MASDVFGAAAVWRVDDLERRIARIEKERTDEREARWQATHRRQMAWIYLGCFLLWAEALVTIVIAIVKHAS